MDIDYLLIILPSIVFLGIFGLILVIWQYGNFRSKKEEVSTAPMDSTKDLTDDIHDSNKELQKTTFTQSLSNEIKKKQQSNTHDTLIILQLLAAEERPYGGYELLQTLSSAGFHYGEMNIFHYYSDPNEKKERLFSLASAIEPGTFDLTHIGEILSPGLCLFMSVNNKNSLNTFELMLETAQLLIQDLGGILCDGQRQALTKNSLTHYRSQLHAYA
ncbi:MAG: cell division protein ZipA [Pseudomonadota bacterium]